MDVIKSQKTQLAKLSLIVLLLLITPLLSTSMRPPYVYFLLNLLIIAVGAEAGLLSFLGTPQDDYHKKPAVTNNPVVVATPKPLANSTSTATPDRKEATDDGQTSLISNTKESSSIVPMKKKKPTTVEKSVSEKIRKVVKVQVTAMKKSPSTPSLFFIGGHDHQDQEEEVLQLLDDHEQQHDEEEVLEVEALSGQELFTKAEMFIGNFYKQLKIQREDSWKKIHGIYHRAF